MTRINSVFQPVWANDSDPDSDVRAELELAHALTRFHRATMGRRAREIGRFGTDKRYVMKATSLREPAVTDIVTALPVPMKLEGSLSDHIQGRRSPDRRALFGTVTDDEISAVTAMALCVNGDRASHVSPDLAYRVRPYPSAGALYPCETYLVRPIHAPERYDPIVHGLVDYGAEPFDFREVETSGQTAPPPCAIVVAADLDRIMPKYGGRGYRFACLEAGHISQNLILAAQAAGLSALPYGAYFDNELERRLGLDGLREIVLAVVLVGPKASGNVTNAEE